MAVGQGFAQWYDSIFLAHGILLFQILDMAMVIYRWSASVPSVR
jgi:hypothetical protein